jgi:alpha-mannosidase
MKRSVHKLMFMGKIISKFVMAAAVLAIMALLPALRWTAAQSSPQESSSPAKEQAVSKPARPSLDLTKQPTLFVVGYAHLDTQWRWEYPQVIQEYLSKTMRSNFYLFEEYPHYIFNFTGANRFMMMKEYYPADFARLKHYVETGRWFPAGSSMEENDVNSPSAESIIRQVLYGNEFFRNEFGKASEEYMLPDCFGFPASLPSILAHAGVKGFSTQKLNAAWQPAPHVGGPDSPEKTP